MEKNVDCIDEDLEFEVNVRNDLHHFKEAEWPSYLESSLFESAVIEAAENLQASKSMALTSALGAMATACQGLIQVEQPTGNVVNTNLMLLTIAESGERKTTVEKVFFSTIRDLQTTFIEDAISEAGFFENKYEIWSIECSALKSELKRCTKNAALKPSGQADRDLEKVLSALKNKISSEPKLCSRTRFIYDDTTPQALVRTMFDNFRDACLVSSESNGIFNGRAFEELHLINSLWDGIDITVDRTSKPSFVLSNARLTLSLMAQMQVIEKFLTKRGEEARGMGFLARFLVVRPEHLAGSRDATVKLSNLIHIKAFNERTKELLLRNINQQYAEEAEDVSRKKMLTFSATAAQRWNTYAQALENAQKIGCVYEFYKDHASKLMDNISRVAGIFHYFHEKNPERTQIQRQTLDYAYSLCMRYSKHFLTYIADEPALIKNTNALITYLYQPTAQNEPDKWDHDASDRYNPQKDYQRNSCFDLEGESYRSGRIIKFSAREIQQYGPSMIRNPKNLSLVINLLTQMGYVKLQQRGRRTHWELHEALIYNTSIFSDKNFVNPMYKNGEEYSIRGLPLFEELKCIEKYRCKRSEFESRDSNSNIGDYWNQLQVFIRCENAEEKFIDAS